MTHKEKAEELVKRFVRFTPSVTTHITMRQAQECAKIAVDEIISELNENFDTFNSFERVEYWQEVKQEIQNL